MYLDEILGVWVQCPSFSGRPAGVSNEMEQERRQALATLMQEKTISIRSESEGPAAGLPKEKEQMHTRNPMVLGFFVIS